MGSFFLVHLEEATNLSREALSQEKDLITTPAAPKGCSTFPAKCLSCVPVRVRQNMGAYIYRAPPPNKKISKSCILT